MPRVMRKRDNDAFEDIQEQVNAERADRTHILVRRGVPCRGPEVSVAGCSSLSSSCMSILSREITVAL